MDIKNQLSTILLASENPLVIESTRTILAQEESLELVDEGVTSKNLIDVITEIQPDVILLDFEFREHPYDLVAMIASKFSTRALVVILPDSEKVDADRVLLSGAWDSIQYPYETDSLVSTIKRVKGPPKDDLADPSGTSDRENSDNHKNTFTIFSPKGGVGTTTIATNIAISLHKTLKEDVLLIDGKHLFGHVALYCNLRTGNSITDLITHGSKLDETLIKQIAVKHTSGIHVLPSPNSIAEAQGIKPENLFRVIQSVQKFFPFIIIDGGNNLNENVVTYMDTSDKILLVLNPDIASMRDVRQFIDISATLSYPKEKTLLILNLTGRKADVQREEIENILKMKIFGKIPADGNQALSSLNEGIPILLKKPRHPMSKAFVDITKELVKVIQTSRPD